MQKTNLVLRLVVISLQMLWKKRHMFLYVLRL